MDDPHTDAEKLAIRCPGCGQRFKVGQELKDRMVECGTCEHRFRVNEEVVVRQKKFYPGERRDRGLEQFSRIPKGAGIPANFQTIQYSQEPAHVPIAGTSPLRMMFGFVAVAGVVLVLLLLAFGGKPGGMLDGATQDKRLMLAAFTAVVAWVFLLAANPAARIKATFGAILCTVSLMAFPFLFTEGNQPLVSHGGTLPLNPVPTHEEKPKEAGTLADLKKEIGYEPLEKELAKYAGKPELAGRSAAGIWLRGLQGFHKPQVQDYIVRTTGADPSSHMYPRNPDYLMVVSGISGDLGALARLCERFGEVPRVIDELRVVEVQVDNSLFDAGDLEKLSDKANPAFYELNRREIESIDLERARLAIGRLADAEPKLYRKDIVARLLQLLKEGDLEMQDSICKALLVWAEPGDGSEVSVRAALAKLVPQAQAVKIPESMLKFLAGRKDAESIPLADALWMSDHDRWEEIYGNFGPPIEALVISHFAGASPPMKRSGARLLGRVGGKASIPILEGARQGADAELAVFIERSLAAIRGRN
ncbi:hypothetical protein [Haloferula sp. BvORR071]|uniref:hypothetical protein n=1 Tax=Haloferula sp. BvORR071 TaxID=1396141 RepID=UPI000553BA50|nr:hypothetical protein [Haloferula sp. BvORR071]